MFTNRESYLTEAAGLILDDILMPIVESSGYQYERPVYRVSMGFPKHSRGGKAIAVCFAKCASSDGVNEIFINPEIDEPVQVMESLLHELIHAIDDLKSGHRNFFAAIARRAGLNGKLTATYAGDSLAATLREYAELLGTFPHQKMTLDNGRKKAATRMLKVECTACGWSFRTSQKHLDAMQSNVCLSCNSSTLFAV